VKVPLWVSVADDDLRRRFLREYNGKAKLN